jgi:glycosyltransferase involved in cell wall biosynthesis
MKALVVAPQPFFTPRGTPLSVYYRTLVTSELGVTVDLLTYGQGRDVEIDRVRILRLPDFRFLGAVPPGPSLPKLFLDLLLLVRLSLLLRRERYDFVHAHEEGVFLCRFLKPFVDFKLVYDMHSSLPEQLTNFRFTRQGALIRWFEKLERSCLETADAVITVSPVLAEYALARMPDRSRHFLIENSLFEDVRIKGNGESETAEELEAQLPSDRTIIAYAGTFEHYQGLDLLIPAIAAVRSSRPEVFLLIIGGDPSRVAVYRRLASACGLEGHSLFTGTLPQPVVRRLLARADLFTSPRSAGMTTPLKIYEQLASGKPLVATRILSHTQVLSDDVCFLGDPTVSSLAEAMLAALSNEERARQVAVAARSLYERRYSRMVYEGKMRQVLEAVA